MAYDKLKPEHTGAKNGGGGWGRREQVKQASRSRRRAADKAEARQAKREMDTYTGRIG